MTQQDIENKYYEVGFALDAIDIITENLSNMSLNNMWSQEEREEAYQQFLKVRTQIQMIKGFTEKARTELESLEQVIIDSVD